jgi:hypothetical protein
MDSSSNPYDGVAAVLAERGWARGDNERPDGSVCLAGACNLVETGSAARAANGSLWSGDLTKSLSPVIAEQFADRGYSGHAMPFNDDARTTRDDVDLVLDKAARRWDEQVDK